VINSLNDENVGNEQTIDDDGWIGRCSVAVLNAHERQQLEQMLRSLTAERV
jgi:hypothetical protein